MRELTTIGNLASLRTMRTIERNSRLMPLRRIGWIGATNPNYVAPSLSEVDAEPPGATLTAATVAMLNHFSAAGVPSVHVSDPFVLSFQQAYNRDPATWAGSRLPLDTDGGFGDNSHDAAAALVGYTGGGSVPAVNRGGAPVVRPPSSTPATVTPSTPTAPGASHKGLWILAIVAAVVAAYAAHKMMKRKRSRRRARALPSRAIVLT